MAHGESVMPLPMALAQRSAAFPGPGLPPFNGMAGESIPPPLLASGGLSRSVNGAAPIASSPSKAAIDGRPSVNHIGLPTAVTTAGVNGFPSTSVSALVPPSRGQAVAFSHGSVMAPPEGRPRSGGVAALISHVPSLIENSKKPETVDQSKLPPLPPPPCSKQKMEFMASLGLVTKDVYNDIKERRMQRRRRRVAPYSMDLAEHEAKRLHELREAKNKAKSGGRNLAPLSSVQLTAREKVVTLKSTGSFIDMREPNLDLSIRVTQDTGCQTDAHKETRKRKRQLLFVTSDEHDCLCDICNRPGELLLCDTCTKAFHFACLPSPLPDLPQGMWICPQCQTEASSTEARAWPGTISLVNAFTKFDEERESQRKRLEEGLRAKRAERDRLSSDLAELTHLITAHAASKDKSVLPPVQSVAQDSGLLHMVKNVKAQLENTIV